MQWVVIIIAFLVWLGSRGSKSSSTSSSTSTHSNSLFGGVSPKYKERVIDTSKSLFERNADIIEIFENKISSYSSRYYYIENETRDCINEICAAEGKISISPKSSYLSSWRSSAPSEWVELSKQIETTFTTRQKAITAVEKKVSEVRNEVDNLINTKVSFR